VRFATLYNNTKPLNETNDNSREVRQAFPVS